MSNANAAVALYDASREVIPVVREIRKTGFDMDQLSVAGQDRSSHLYVTGRCRNRRQMQYWGESEADWNELLEELTGCGIYEVSEIGRLLVVGPLAGWIAAALPNSPIFGDMSALGMGLYSVGISRITIRFCDEALRAGRFVLVVNGPAQEVKKVRGIMEAL